MKSAQFVAVLTVFSLGARVWAANPFLDTPDGKPLTALFRGRQWSDEIGPKDIPLTARVVTTCIARMRWGAVFRIEFRDLQSPAKQRREIPPDYYIATDDQIVLLNEDDNEAAARRLAALDKPPEFLPNDVYGIASGRFEHEEGPWTNTIEVQGDRCTFSASHNSGHFKTVVWQKGVGLVEYAGGYGAHANGYRLKLASHR